mmetsp:Transcript_19728/g.29918  ORF Transcript_19728/g.29918 Transcript_19728/m.29918 type:complete len:91 (-) Transcript_19728:70-342(-)
MSARPINEELLMLQRPLNIMEEDDEVTNDILSGFQVDLNCHPVISYRSITQRLRIETGKSSCSLATTSSSASSDTRTSNHAATHLSSSCP